MNEPITDLLLGRMFLARAVSLWAGAVLAALAFFGFYMDRISLLLPLVELVWSIGIIVALIVISAGSLVTWYYTFCAGLHEGGVKYAVGHLMVCAALTPIALAGIIFLPLLVYYDIERWRQSATIPGAQTAACPGVIGSFWGGFILLAWDAGLFGSFLLSFKVCPIWFLVSVLKNAIQRPGWRLALVRIAIPALTLGLVLANKSVQWRIAEANASQVIAACEEFNAANGRFPKTLDELVPRYMPFIPRAKYCLVYGEFRYMNNEHPMLVWHVVPPYGRNIYDFEKRRWHYLD
jgi:hypothetical protein